MKYEAKSPLAADIGDYLKVFACTAVMLQIILVEALQTHPSPSAQIGIGIFYDLTKFTAPAFIAGILYTTTRIAVDSNLTYRTYLIQMWHALFIPTIAWTTIYLLVMPWVQQVHRYHDLQTFAWQFINGNAAPHLWYNSMMLQFIILMPVFWWLARWCGQNRFRGILVLITVSLIQIALVGLLRSPSFSRPSHAGLVSVGSAVYQLSDVWRLRRSCVAVPPHHHPLFAQMALGESHNRWCFVRLD